MTTRTSNWKYKLFRLRMVDTNVLPEDATRWYGIGWYPDGDGAVYREHENVQISIMTGRKEYIFDLWKIRGREV